MDEKTLPVIDSVFFPYYVNQNRLLDIYAILNKGFSEYEEIKEGSSSGKSSSKRGGAGVGFKILALSQHTVDLEHLPNFLFSFAVFDHGYNPTNVSIVVCEIGMFHGRLPS